MTVICIAGMHRSGTSMVARLLNLSGIYLGPSKELMPPAPDNAEGFWENIRFVEINEQILQKLKGGWDLSPRTGFDWTASPEFASLREQASNLIKEFNDASNFWGWKDPRNSLTLPFWRQLVPGLKVIICLRNPLEVANSLTKRGFNSTAFGINLWNNYNMNLLAYITPPERLITHYDSYFIEPETELDRLLKFIGLSPSEDATIAEVCRSATLSLKHNHATFDDLEALKSDGFKEAVDLYVQMCMQAGSVYWGKNFNEFQVSKLEGEIPPLFVSFAEMNHSLVFLLKEKDDALKEKDDALKEKDNALKEKDNALKEKDNALKEKDNALKEKDNALKEKDADFNKQLENIYNSRAWKLAQFLQSCKSSLAPSGGISDKFFRLAFKVFQVWRQDGFKGLMQKLISRYGWKNPTLVVALTERETGASPNPKVSIIIPVFNGFPLTRECVQSIYYKTTSDVTFEIIVVDNASKDQTPSWLKAERKEQKNFRVFTMEKNMGFGPAVNYGIGHSGGEYIVVLNNDTIVSSGWLTNLLDAIQKDPSIGIVSPVTNYVGEGPQIDENAKDLPPDLNMIEQYAGGIANRSRIICEPNRLVFFCVLLKRELVDTIGYLDESYEKGNFEDDDYCLRARMAGYKLAIVMNSFVYHHGSATFTHNRISHSQYMERNRERFYKKAGRIATSSFPSKYWLGSQNDIDISIIVRTKNRPKLLERALTSIKNQTFKRFEVVLINDGGEDISEVIDRLRLPVTLVSNASSVGRTAAVNQGLSKSRGGWFAFLDDDDIIYPWHLEALFQAIQRSGCKFVYSDYNRALFVEARRNIPDKLIGSPSWEYRRPELLIQNYIPVHTWLYARDCFDKFGGWDESLDRLEDFEFLLRISEAYDFCHLKKVTSEYRYYLDSANSIYTDRQKTLDALQYIYKRYPVADQESISRREDVIIGMKNQIRVIEALKENADDEKTAVREIVRLVTGL